MPPANGFQDSANGYRKSIKNLINPSKISISVAANGYVPMSARRGRTPGSAGFQYETLENVVKTKVSAFALA